jgi:hypothetical protein
VAAGRWQGAVSELAGSTERASGYVGQGWSSPERWWRMLGAAVLIGGEGALVAGGDGGTTL